MEQELPLAPLHLENLFFIIVMVLGIYFSHGLLNISIRLQMTGETSLDKLLKTMKPKLNIGDFVFCAIEDLTKIDINSPVMIFKEEEKITIIVRREIADYLKLDYSFIASWITLTVHSSLNAVGLTAAFSKELSDNGISCNVIAAYYHDHIFVDKKDAEKAMNILNGFSE